MRDKDEGAAEPRGPCTTVGGFLEWCMEPGSLTWLRTKISASLQAWGERAEAAAYGDRDAEWRAAIETAHYDSIDGLHLDCEQCAPLRTLMENAPTGAP